MAETTKKFLSYESLSELLEKLVNPGYKGNVLVDKTLVSNLDSLFTSLTPEDISELSTRVSALENLVEADSNEVIDKFNEIVAFLKGINPVDEEGKETLENILSGIATQIAEVKSAAETAQGAADDVASAFNTFKDTTAPATYVAKVNGKDLSDNNYDDAAVAKVANLPANTVSEIADAKKAGTDADEHLTAYKTEANAAIAEAKKAGTDAADTVSELSDAIDTANYIKHAELVEITTGEIDALMAAE